MLFRSPLLFGASTLLLEGARAIGIPVYLRPWYEAATQVGRVIPQPLLHPVPLIFVASAGLLLGLAAALLPVESIVRYCRQSWRSSRMYFRKNKS